MEGWPDEASPALVMGEVGVWCVSNAWPAFVMGKVSVWCTSNASPVLVTGEAGAMARLWAIYCPVPHPHWSRAR